ncbi:hypothetical protein ACXX9E_29655 [Pseudomonas sp. GNP014]
MFAVGEVARVFGHGANRLGAVAARPGGIRLCCWPGPGRC